MRPLSTGGTNVGADPDPDKGNKQTNEPTIKQTEEPLGYQITLF